MSSHNLEDLNTYLDATRGDVPVQQRWAEMAERINVPPALLANRAPHERELIWDAVKCRLLAGEKVNPTLKCYAEGVKLGIARALSEGQHRRYEGPERFDKQGWLQVINELAELNAL